MFSIRPAAKMLKASFLGRGLRTASTSTTHHSFTSSTTTKIIDETSTGAKASVKSMNSGNSYERAPDHVSAVSWAVYAFGQEIMQNKEFWDLAKAASVFSESNRAAMFSTLAAGLLDIEAKKLKKTAPLTQASGHAVYQHQNGMAQSDIRPDDCTRLPTCGCEFCESLGHQRCDKWGPY